MSDSRSVHSRSRKLLAGAALMLALLYGGIGWFFSGLVIHFKQRSLEEDRKNLAIESPAAFGLPVPEDVVIDSDVSTGEDVPLRGWYFAKAGQPRCAVLIQHGHTGTRWGALKYAPLFWKRGCALLAMDARYHGESGGSCGSYGYHEREDAQHALAWLAQKTGLDKSRIGLMGESMGAAIVLLTAAREPDLAFVGADSPYSALVPVLLERGSKLYPAALIQALMPLAVRLAGARCDFDPFDVTPAGHAPELKMPVFLSHSKADDGTPYYHSQRIFDGVGHSRKVLHLHDRGSAHGRDINDRPAEYAANMDAFLREFASDFGG